ncbi:DUF410-domain-containing protein, partial [Calocera viscosa TUFC12733]
LGQILPLIPTSAYSAHQKARTTYSRLVKARPPQYDVAIEVLFVAARELMKVKEFGSGTDLTGLLLDCYEKAGVGVDDTSRSRLTQLIALTDNSGSWRRDLIVKSVNWSATACPCPAGDPGLHHYIGELYYKEGHYDLAEPHLLSSPLKDSARLLAASQAAWFSSVPAPSPFPYAARAVLSYLLQANFSSATTFLAHFIPAVPALSRAQEVQTAQDSAWVTGDPGVNCLQLLVATCRRSGDAVPQRDAWRALTRRYLTVLAGPELGEAARALGEMYFAIVPPGGGGRGNMMQEMMAQLFGGPAP